MDVTPEEIEKDPGVSWDPSYFRIIQEHPCYSVKASHQYGRMHVPVAPKCNIQCKYCVRKFDCVNESRPGVTSKIIMPSEALEKVEEVISRFPWIKVIGIAGPGDPLVNEETFITLKLVREKFPKLKMCLSTNGLILPDKLSLLKELKVATLTVTINAVDATIGKEIYAYIYYQNKLIIGWEAAHILISKQLEGVKSAVKNGIYVKINTVFIPSINGDHLIEIAKKLKELGVYIQNIMPLIPQGAFSNMRPPTPEEVEEARKTCSTFIRQMRHCRQCRADAIGKLGEDMPILCSNDPKKMIESSEAVRK